MSQIKSKELAKMAETEREKRLEELKLELVKSKVKGKTENTKVKEIKKMIAKILTLNRIGKNKMSQKS